MCPCVHLGESRFIREAEAEAEAKIEIPCMCLAKAIRGALVFDEILEKPTSGIKARRPASTVEYL